MGQDFHVCQTKPGGVQQAGGFIISGVQRAMNAMEHCITKRPALQLLLGIQHQHTDILRAAAFCGASAPGTSCAARARPISSAARRISVCWCWMPKSSCSVRSMYLQELNFILLFTGGGEHNVDFIVQRPYFSRLAEGGPHSGTPVDAMGPLVTTASLGYKEQDRHVFQRLKELDALGLAAEYFDFDDSPARSFADYNAAVFFGQ